jgi:hypothetical protein
MRCYYDYVPIHERIENIYYYSFEHLFLFTVTKLLFFYGFIVVPLNMYLENVMYHSHPMIRLVVQAVAVMVIALPLSFMLGVLPESRLRFVLLFALGMMIFLVIEFFIKLIVKSIRRKNNAPLSQFM